MTEMLELSDKVFKAAKLLKYFLKKDFSEKLWTNEKVESVS